ncbi:hypothetical protein K501DRAFT_244699 [Backusella circina FSU 941]|nr:hypothetical protein K501DRAFT_244699 [Backusella circina FSU 941]
MSTTTNTTTTIQVKFNNHEALSDFITLTTNNILPLKPTTKDKTPLPNFDLFVFEFIQRANLPCAVFLFTLIYLVRLKSKLPKNAHGASDTPFRLFLAAVLTSSKYLLERGMSNISMALMTCQLYTAREINHMERSFLRLLRYDLWVSVNEIHAFMNVYGELIQADLSHAE